MKRYGAVRAEFTVLGYATAAIDWFRNQAVSPDVISISVIEKNEQPRPPRRGDETRADLRWIIGIDLERVSMTRQVALDTLRREGGRLLRR